MVSASDDNSVRTYTCAKVEREYAKVFAVLG